MNGPGARLRDLIAAVPPFDPGAAERACERQAVLIKPPGSLGRLEELAVQVAGVTGDVAPRGDRRWLAVFAADHGVAGEGVSAYPATVTAQIVAALARGDAAAAVLARSVGARLLVVDVGLASPATPCPGVRSCRVRSGTASFLHGPAMSREEALAAVAIGAEAIDEAGESGLDLLALGEVGIGNTTAAAAFAAAVLGLPPKDVVGRGTGIDDAALVRKVAVVRKALQVNAVDRADPVGVLAGVGGLEIAAMVGAMLRAGGQRVPVVLDGFVVGAAALVAVVLCPNLRPFLIAGHQSPEPGHAAVLAALGLSPLFDYGMRLGEGSGAVVALGVVGAALDLHRGMATFAEAGVDGATGR